MTHRLLTHLLRKIGRSRSQDTRVIGHELGHYKINHIINGKSKLSLVPVTPSDGYDEICRGGDRSAAFVSDKPINASNIRKILEPSMPHAGDDRDSKSDIFQSVFDAVTEPMAEEAAEGLLQGDAIFASDDRRQAKELAALICASSQAIDAFIAFCLQQARDLLAPYVPVLALLQDVLRVRRDMTGEELDYAGAIISDQIAEKKRWRERPTSLQIQSSFGR
jgi:hypothetical protein